MDVVRSIWRRAPKVGSPTRIYCGVAKTDGRHHYTVVAGKADRLRKCRVVGYVVNVGPAASSCS